MAAFLARDILLSLLGLFPLCLPLVSAHDHLWHRDARTVTISGPAPSSAPSASYTTESALIDSVLNSTNIFRGQHNATVLAWNTSLADAASSWASNCRFDHSGGPTGENLAVGYPDMASAIDAWGNERDLYDFSRPTGFTKATGHFTQLVWKETSSLGCAAVDCNGKNSLEGFLVVCEYSPSGNVVGQGNAHFRSNVQVQVRFEEPQQPPTPPQPPPPPPPPPPPQPAKPAETTITPPPPPPSFTLAQVPTVTVVEVATTTEVVTLATRARSTAVGLSDETDAADQLQVETRKRWTMAVTLAAIFVAGAIG